MINQAFKKQLIAMLSIALLFVYAAPLKAKNKTDKLDLSEKEAVLLAVRQNPIIINGEIQRVADKFALAVAHNKFAPQCTFDGSSSYSESSDNHNALVSSSLTPGIALNTRLGTVYSLSFKNQYNQQSGSHNHYSSELVLNIKQPLLRGAGKNIVLANLNTAILTELKSRIAFKNTMISQINTVLSNYRAVIQDKENLVIQQHALKNNKHNIWVYKEKIKAGQLAPAGLNEIKKSLFQDRLNLTNAKNVLDTAKQTLLTSLGLDPHAHIQVAKQLDMSHHKIPPLKQSIKTGLQHNLDYQSALIGLANAKIALAQSLDAARWQLDLDANVNNQTAGSNQSRSIGLNLSIPIDDMSIKKGILDAKTSLKQTTLSLKQQKWQLESNIITAINSLKSDAAQIKLAKQTLKYAEISYRVTQKKIALGRSTTFELTSKATELTNAKQSLLSVKINFLNDYAKLDALLGNTLTRWHLQLPG